MNNLTKVRDVSTIYDISARALKYYENDDIWSVAHSATEEYIKEIGYIGNGGSSELYPFDRKDIYPLN